MYLPLVRGAAVLEQDGAEVMAQGIHGRHQHADIGRDTADDYRVAAPRAQCLIEIGLEKGAEAPFRQYHVSLLNVQKVGDLGARLPPDCMVFHLTVKDKISRQEGITGKDDGHPQPPSLL